MLAEGPRANTKVTKIDMYYVPLMLGVNKLLKFGIIWIIGFTISDVVLIVGQGSEGGTKLSTKAHGLLVSDGMVGVGKVEDMVGTGEN